MAVDRDKILQAAQKLVEKKRYDKAIVEYQKLVADDPKDVRTLLKIGDLYLKMEQHADAIGTYERVGQFYSQQGLHLKAIAVYKQIREIIHKHVPHLEDRFGHIVPKLAQTYSQLGLTSDALAAYDEVATRYQRAGRDRDAIDVFRKVVDLDPQNPLPHLRLAEALMRVKDVDTAIQRFGAAAEILLKLGRRDDALKVVERLLQHRADVRFARIAAEIYLERSDPTDAMAALSKLQICFKENPKDLETLALLARAFDKLNQPAKSVEVQKEAARIAKDAGKLDTFNALVEALLTRAPLDEGVRQLVAMRAEQAPAAAPPAHPQAAPHPSTPAHPAERAPAAPAPPRQPAPNVAPRVQQPSTVELDIDDAEVIMDEDLAASSTTPFALQKEGPAAEPAYPLVRPGERQGVADTATRVRQVLARVDALRHAKDYDRAVAMLLEAVEQLPGAGELREKLCDVLIEAGDQAEAVRQMLSFAQWLAGAGDVETATRILDEVLLLEPTQPEAVQMLRELGYAVPTEEGGEYAADAQQAVYTDGGQPSGADAPVSPYDPSAPLPSYDLEEVGAGEALRGGDAGHEHRAFAPSQLDDPFGEAPLPSFPMEDEAAAYDGSQRDSVEIAVPQSLPSGTQLSVGPMPASPSPVPPAYEPPPGMRPPAPSLGALDEEALEEVEFFASNGMFDEARNLLEEQLGRMPNHPLLLERLRELEEHAAAVQGDASGTRAVPRDEAGYAETGAGAPPSAMPGSARYEDRSFDIAASLDALDALDAGPPREGSQVSVESVFEQFKAGVAASISESDAATHYDLGVAYKEMGLVTDAIAEFDLAARDPGRECVCQSMIGMIYREHGNVNAAIDAFNRGLHAKLKTPDQEMALTYEIGDCYEERRSVDQALYYFQRVARMNPAYDDMRGSVAERVRRLDPAPVGMPAAKAVGAETVDEFDAVLDDLLGGGKLP